MLVAAPDYRAEFPLWLSSTVMILLLIYPALTLTVAGAVNTVFFVLFLLGIGALLAFRPFNRVSYGACSSPDPLSPSQAWLYALAMAALPLAVFIGQWANDRWGWPYYDAVSRFLLSTAIFFSLRRIPAQKLMIVWYGLVIGAFSSAMVAVVMPHNWGSDDGVARIGSSFVNPIHFGDIALTLGVLPLFGLGWRSDGGAVRRHGDLIWAVLALMAGSYASILSGSRGGWIALPVFAALALLINRSDVSKFHLGWSALGSVVLLGSIWLALPEFRHRIDLVASNLKAFDRGHESTSIGVRLQLWKAAWLIFTQHPWFGVGMGGFKEWMGPMQQAGLLTPMAADFGRQEVHSEILSRLSQLGLVGLCAILAVYVVPVWLFWHRLRCADPASRAAARMGLAFVVGFVVYGLTVETFDLTMTAAFYALTTAVLLAAAYPLNSQPHRPACSAS